MARRIALATFASTVLCAAIAASAAASSPIRLYLAEGYAFRILGHSCGGIQQKSYTRGFGANGYPVGNVYMSTTCGGSGRGGGGHSTTYTGTATVEWTWFGETRSFGTPAGPLEATPAEDGHGDKVYNSGTIAYLEVGTPPLEPPAAPTNVSASIGLAESGETEFLRMAVGWTVAPEAAVLIKSSTVTATPVGSPAPVLSTTVSAYWSSAFLQPVEPNTTYRVTVTNTDSEGTSAPSEAVEVKSPNSDGESEKEREENEKREKEKEEQEIPRCAKAAGTIKLSPGLTETAHVQSILFAGTLSSCAGPLGIESGKFVEHLKTTSAVSCPVLASSPLESNTTSTSLALKWAPKSLGSSSGWLLFPLTELGGGLAGMLKGGPFPVESAVRSESVTEIFNGGATCGVPNGKKKAKPVTTGTFSTSEVEL